MEIYQRDWKWDSLINKILEKKNKKGVFYSCQPPPPKKKFYSCFTASGFYKFFKRADFHRYHFILIQFLLPVFFLWLTFPFSNTRWIKHPTSSFERVTNLLEQETHDCVYVLENNENSKSTRQRIYSTKW